MAETATPEPGVQRRRSTRIVRTISLTVRGVDLLSQPFEERTSTLSFNTHGCKYPSKHHLPKNSWVTLEIPGREGAERRRVRARVVWIQKPHSVRELFQIAVELEAPGNIWSLDAPPGDWTNTVPSPLEPPVAGQSSAEMMSSWLRTEEKSHVRSEPISIERSKPGLETPLSDIFAGNVDENQSRGGEGSAAGFGFPGSVELEAGEAGSFDNPLLRELRAHIDSHAARVVGEAAARASETLQRTAETVEREHIANAEVLFQHWKEDFESERRAARDDLSRSAAQQISTARDEIAAHFTGQMSWVREELRSDLKQEFTSHLDQMRALVADLERGAEALREEANAAASASDRMAQIKIALEAAEAAVDQRMRKLKDAAQETVALDDLSREWRDRLEEQMKQARGEWDELLQGSLDGAAQRLASRVAEHSQSALDVAANKLSERITQITQPVTGAVHDAQQALAGIRASLEEELQRARTSLGEIERAADRMKEFSGQIDAASHDAVNQLHRRLDAALEAQVAELHRHADVLAADLPQRVQPALESAGQQFVARVLGEIDDKLGPHLERVPELVRELTAHEVQAEESLRMYRERLRQAAESSRRDAATQMQATVADLRNDFEAARTDAISRWNEELSSSGARATHAAIENLVKSAEWHQKQAQDYIEKLTQESLAKAEGFFEDRTREASERLTEELAQRKTAFVENVRVDLDSTASAVVSRAGSQFERAAATAASGFEEQIGASSSKTLRMFSESNDALLAEKEGQVLRISDRVRENFEAAAAILLDRFRDQISAHGEDKIAEARDVHSRELAAAVEAARIERDAQAQDWYGRLARANEELLRKYEDQLHDTNEVWMNAAVQKLDENGQLAVASLSLSGEQALRGSFLKIFEQIAETIRQSVAQNAESASDTKAMAAGASSSSAAPAPLVNPGNGPQETHAGA
ncbi:MAG: hypothetical protein WA002_00385 [Candidatus Acidiferrales bacterium]